MNNTQVGSYSNAGDTSNTGDTSELANPGRLEEIFVPIWTGFAIIDIHAD